MYVPETPFQATGDATMIYTLRQEGWRKGEPVMVNDVAISFNLIRDDALRHEIVNQMVVFLNARYPTGG